MTNTKRFLSLLIAAMMVFSLSLTVGAARASADDEHTHTWGDPVWTFTVIQADGTPAEHVIANSVGSGFDMNQAYWVESAVATFTCEECGESVTRTAHGSASGMELPHELDYEPFSGATFLVFTPTVTLDGETYSQSISIKTDSWHANMGYFLWYKLLDPDLFQEQHRFVDIDENGDYVLEIEDLPCDIMIFFARAIHYPETLGEGHFVEHIINYYDDPAYITTEDTSGHVKVYFNPNGHTEWESFFEGGYFYIEKIEDEPELLPQFKTHSLVLSGQIGINFFMDLSMLTEEQRAASYVTFDISGKGTITDRADYNASYTNPSGTYYGFTAYVNSIQMADTITATYHYGDGLTVEETYTVKQYIELFEDNMDQFDEITQALIKSLADYGHYVQPFLSAANHWTIGTDYAEMDKFFTDSYTYNYFRSCVAKYAIKREMCEDVAQISYSLSLDSATGIYVYFTPVTGYNGSIVVKIDGVEVTPEWEENAARYLVEIANISAHELMNTHEVLLVTDNGKSVCKVSAMSYVEGVLNSPTYADDTNALNAVCALYNYAYSAMKYKATQQ